MRIGFYSIPVDIPSKKTGRIYSRAILQDIAQQLNTAPQEILIINHVGERPRMQLDYGRACGSVMKGSAAIVDNVLTMTARFYNKDFFLAHPFEYTPELKKVDLTTGNIMEKFTQLDMIEYSPVGEGSLDMWNAIKDYRLTYIFGKPKETHNE
jgi:hypothetical protein